MEGKNRQPINLTKFNAELQYVCDDCGILLLEYSWVDAAKEFPKERGPHLICPKCHLITDLSQFKPPGLDDIQPIDLKPPTFVMSLEDKGQAHPRLQDYDPEGDTEDKWLKSIGATLISKKIQV